MILLDTPPKDAKATLSQLLLGKSGKPDAETFSKILKELSLTLGGEEALSKEEIALLLTKEGKEQESKIAPGLLLKLDADDKTEAAGSLKTNDSLLALLKGEDAIQPDSEEIDAVKLLNPKMLELPIKDIRQIMADAKNFLKEQLSELVQEKEMPKTLKGLIQLAEKRGIEVSKITIEQVMPKQAATENRPLQKALPKEQPLFQEKQVRELGIQKMTTAELVQNKQLKTPDTKPDQQPLKNLLQDDNTADIDPQAKLKSNKKSETTEAIDADMPQPLSKKSEQAVLKSDNKAEQAVLKSENKGEQATLKSDNKPEQAVLKSDNKPEQAVLKSDNKAEQATLKSDNKAEQATLKSDNKVEQATLKSENKTEQAVAKSATLTETPKIEPKQENAQPVKTDAAAAHTTLKSGNAQEHGSKSGDQLFKNTPAEPVTETALKTAANKPEFSSALSHLLHGNENRESDAKSEGESRLSETQNIKTAQAATAQIGKEALEIKMNEARQMVRHFAGEIREAIQNYKPPFTRLKIQLNPAKFGEVDVTMVQRGNNVHINISSNSAAINTLAQNASELRTQLSQNGLNNATMNFSSNSNPEQQQNQQRQHLAELYEQFEESENFDLMESLELIIPRYI